MKKRDNIEIWTDGACEPNPGPGAYGVHIIWQNGTIAECDGFSTKTTNNRMEMMGPIVALEHVKKQRGRIIVYSDILPDRAREERQHLEDAPSWILEWEAEMGRGRKVIDPNDPAAA